MSRLDDVIADIKNVDRVKDIWIFDENGNIRDDVICGDVIPFLEELKNYEVKFDSKEIESKAIELIEENATNTWNTYNWCANISHNIDVAELEFDDYVYMAIMVHRFGDARGNYTDRFVVKFDNIDDIYYFESRTQYKDINDRYTCDIDIFTEWYDVWDNDNQTNIGEFYEIEVKDLLDEIEERA